MAYLVSEACPFSSRIWYPSLQTHSYLDAGDENLLLDAHLDELRSLGVDGLLLVRVDGAPLVDGIADDVDDPEKEGGGDELAVRKTRLPWMMEVMFWETHFAVTWLVLILSSTGWCSRYKDLRNLEMHVELWTNVNQTGIRLM